MAEDSDRSDTEEKLKRRSAILETMQQRTCRDCRPGRDEEVGTKRVAERKKGDVRDAPGSENDPYVIDLARFAIAEHNKNANGPLEFERLIKVSNLAVSGTLYYFTIEARDREVKKLYKAQVWDRPCGEPELLRDFRPCYSLTRDTYSNGRRYEFCSFLIRSLLWK
ncbi:hypothetical protein PR202_ga09330 [Eleusine coracana subsp. coracana]|uniref:Cysteine proteinase inhibitor n=1 Tax=Eleusine coracana subsp. coracana TaxID=191504 RepID=A0AAV5C2V8_ELECO|nr:hypothetical protein PR202_ga09330 [Eleusine coracana subsp. coracana]